MRHRKAGIKLNRTTSHRQAMFRNMVTSLFKYERIKTTDAKAKELRRWADNMITLAKRGDLHARRQALAIMREKAVVHKLFEEAPKRYGNINGGYTRVVKLARRAGDAAPVSMVELVVPEEAKKTKKKKSKDQVTPQAKETIAPVTAPDPVDEQVTPAEKTAQAEDAPGASEPAEEAAPEEVQAEPSPEASDDDPDLEATEPKK